MLYLLLGIAIVGVVIWFFCFRTPTPTSADYKKKFEGKVVVITGASSGLGQELAKQLAVYKPKLVLAARTVDKLKELEKYCTEKGAEVLVVETDVSKTAHCKALVDKTLEKFAAINVLYLNAGVAQRERLRNIKDPVYLRQIMDTNYFGSTEVAFFALEALRASKGHIVVTSSVVSKLIIVGGAAYTASKAAVNSFFDVLRAEECRNGIKVTTICPGYVPTDIVANSITGDGSRHGKNENLHFKMSLDSAVKLMISSTVSNKMEVWYTLAGTIAMTIRGAFPNVADRIMYKVRQ